MAPPSSPSSSGITNSPSSLLPRRSSLFTPIQEGNESEDETISERHRHSTTTTPTPTHHHHYSTPLHPSPQPQPHNTKHFTKKRPPRENPSTTTTTTAATVSCNNCRPTTRDNKTGSLIVPVFDNNKHHSISIPSPNKFLKSILSTLSLKSPKNHPTSETSSTTSSTTIREEDQWKHAATELSTKLIHASRKRDEAILEASKLKHSMSQLEKKLTKLENYCHTLKSGLEICNNNNNNNSPSNIKSGFSVSPFSHIRMSSASQQHDQILENFLTSVSESRSSVRLLSRALTVQIRQTGTKPLDRITSLLQPYDIKLSHTKNPKSLVFYLESLLNLTLYTDFESPGFSPSSSTKLLNPLDRCESNYGVYESLNRLTWEEVLSKGTKYYDEEFSRFCDRKMSEIVTLLSWNRAWSESLLQAFFQAAKCLWLVHLLANSVHPALPVFRVEKGCGFDSVYMEDMGSGGGGCGGRKGGGVVRIMVAPGFYVYDSVVKCKVLCKYSAVSSGGGDGLVTP